MDVNAANNVAQSADLMAQVLQAASVQSTELAEKMVKVNLETQLASIPGMGDVIDVQAWK